MCDLENGSRSDRSFPEIVYSPEMPPLTGLRVLDLTQAIAGPLCAMFCADLGAEVIKIEPPGGDLSRGIPIIIEGANMSTYYASANRNKKTICLDLKSAEGMAAVYKLIADSDVVIVNDPNLNHLKQQGLDIETLQKFNPSIIEVGISLFGHTGPLANTRGFDLAGQFFIGAPPLTGEKENETDKKLKLKPFRFPGPYVDVDTARTAFTEVMIALFRRSRTKEKFAQFLDCSMINSTAIKLYNILAEAATLEKEPPREGNGYAYIEPYGFYEAADGGIAITVVTPRNWEALCHGIGREDLILDPRFSTNERRTEEGNREALEAIIVPWIRQHTVDELEKIFKENGVLAQRMQTVLEFIRHKQTEIRKIMVSVTKNGQTIKVPNNPFAESGLPMAEPEFPHEIGEDTEEIFTRLGYTQEEIKRLRESHIIA